MYSPDLEEYNPTLTLQELITKLTEKLTSCSPDVPVYFNPPDRSYIFMISSVNKDTLSDSNDPDFTQVCLILE